MRSVRNSRQDTSIHKELSKGNLKAVPLELVPSRICTKYEKIYENGSQSKRVVYVKRKNSGYQDDNNSIDPSINKYFQECKNVVIMEEELRMEGGGHSPHIVNVMSSTGNSMKKCRKREHPSESCPQPTHIQLKLSDSVINPHLQRQMKCVYMGEGKRPRRRTRGTQTLFRESSAQTLPYLPGVANDKEILKNLELFKLPKILKGDGPPGLYEVEILERARRRWAFEKALKEKFESQMKNARLDIDRKKHITQHKTILEAFEWEHWLQREENIQSCQMMRFDLVLRIFEKRERDMHDASNIRIQRCCLQIAAKRDAGLKKNEVEYGRQLRRLKIKHEQRPRYWRKEKISNQLGDPSSEYYAPQMRYGVNPNRRHFQLSRKAFEMRMEDLEKRAVNMKNLECPFAKLKEWSKPKEPFCEVEQNFCSDANLQKLYESLKGLREQSKKQKIEPKCLVQKIKVRKEEPSEEVIIDEDYIIEEFDLESEELSCAETIDEETQAGTSYSQNSLIEMISQRNTQTFSIPELLNERTCEELEGMLAEYEGTTIGWLMRFLSEEMSRLQEQRKLHFVTMLTQKERWRREAAEAGLRQKENEMRKIYEKVFDETDEANVEVCEQYLDNIFGIDTREQADFEATVSITQLARIIDTDLQRWLSSFKLIQHPLNYHDLRCLLRDLVFPDNVAECLIQRYENKLIIDYIINDVLFPHITEIMDKLDVSAVIANELVDRLIDNDLYIFSPECSSECDCGEVCECGPAELEAKAIIRKLVRYSVPGRRWRTSTERIADVNIDDLLTDVCGEIDPNKRCPFPQDKSARRRTIQKVPSIFDLLGSKMDDIFQVQSPKSSSTITDNSQVEDVTIIRYRKPQQSSGAITKSLVPRNELNKTDTGPSSGSQLLDITEIMPPSNESTSLRPSFLKKVTSTLDLTVEASTMGDVETYGSTSTSTEKLENYVRIQGRRSTIPKKGISKTDSFPNDILDEIVKTIIPIESADEIEENDFDADLSEDGSETGTFETKRLEYIRSISYEDMTFSTESPTEKTQMIEEAGQIYMEEEQSDVVDVNVDVDIEAKPSEYEMVMYVGELNRILLDDPDECLCQMEIDYKNHIRELYESGKIKLIKKQRSSSEYTTDNVEEASHLVFEYLSDDDNRKSIASTEKDEKSLGQNEAVALEDTDFVDDPTDIQNTTEADSEGIILKATEKQTTAQGEIATAENIDGTVTAVKPDVTVEPVDPQLETDTQLETETQPQTQPETQPDTEPQLELEPEPEANDTRIEV